MPAAGDSSSANICQPSNRSRFALSICGTRYFLCEKYPSYLLKALTNFQFIEVFMTVIVNNQTIKNLKVVVNGVGLI